jgi:hypothetical protein
MRGFPDPIASANIYCAGHLDYVIFRAIKPFRNALKDLAPAAAPFLWMVRHGKCGEHVKVRVHSLSTYDDALRDLLEHHVQEAFACLPPTSPAAKSNLTKQVIDLEDGVDEPYTNRTLLWTRYQRSYVSLGPSPLLEDDRYVELCTRCLAAAADLLFTIEPYFTGELPHRYRHSSLLKMLTIGMEALMLSPEDVASYILYHRDWLIRFCLVKNWWTREQAERLIDLFDRRVRDQSLLEPAVTLIANGSVLLEEEPDRVWGRNLKEFFLYNSGLHEIHDPFARRPEYLPLFKVLHGTSNQIGMRHLDEAFLYHVFLAALRERYSLPLQAGYSESEPSRIVNNR